MNEPTLQDIERAASEKGAEPLYTQAFWRTGAQMLLKQSQGLCDQLTRLEAVRPLATWHDDVGDVLWWRFPIEEPPYVGSPLDTNWPGYHTHWTPIPVVWHPK